VIIAVKRRPKGAVVVITERYRAGPSGDTRYCPAASLAADTTEDTRRVAERNRRGWREGWGLRVNLLADCATFVRYIRMNVAQSFPLRPGLARRPNHWGWRAGRAWRGSVTMRGERIRSLCES